MCNQHIFESAPFKRVVTGGTSTLACRIPIVVQRHAQSDSDLVLCARAVGTHAQGVPRTKRDVWECVGAACGIMASAARLGLGPGLKDVPRRTRRLPCLRVFKGDAPLARGQPPDPFLTLTALNTTLPARCLSSRIICLVVACKPKVIELEVIALCVSPGMSEVLDSFCNGR
jgi:hypothetical protein